MGVNESAFPPDSDQLDAIDLHAGPRTFTIERTGPGPDEKRPVNVYLREFPRPWRPNRTTGRTLEKAYGVDQQEWIGKRVTLFRDPDVTFGKERPGGIRISHLSGIASEQRYNVGTVRPQWVTVTPLPDEPAPAPAPKPEPLTDDAIACCTDQEQLRTWFYAYPEQQDAIAARKAELDAAAPQDGA